MAAALMSAAAIFTLLVARMPGLTASAADPAANTLSPAATAPLTWNGTATAGGALNAPLGLIGGEDLCEEGVTCDTFTLTLAGTPDDWAGKLARVEINWLSPTTDYDLYVHKDSNSGPIVDTSGRGATSPTEPLTMEDVDLDPAIYGTGVYSVHVVYYAATAGDQYRGSAAVAAKPAATPTPTPPPPSAEPTPRFFNYAAPGSLGRGAGEPTLGVNWKTGNAMFIAGLETLRVTFDDSSSPAKANWKNVSALNTSIRTLDPLLFTDSDIGKTRTNRTFVSQLAGKASLMSYTDDDGDTWTASQGSGINSGVDHQTVGGGPFHQNNLGIGPTTSYPHAVYYASQDGAMAQAAVSLDGGQTYGPAVPMYTLADCGGLHGHIKVAPDGTVYVPNSTCTEQGVLVSEDNGLTWDLRTVPGSTEHDSDPSVGIGSDGTVYFAYSNGDGHPHVAVSRDRGLTWTDNQELGGDFGIQNAVFPAAVAGDADRAAVFFLGTTTPGEARATSDDATFDGVWYGFISMTYDGGKTWVTTNATPNDPVQRGPVCGFGPTCGGDTRNLLDFNDATVDQRGRVLAAFADGCVTGGCIQGVDKNKDGKVDGLDNDATEIATIIRQSGGKGLFKEFDVAEPHAPASPLVVASLDKQTAYVSWSTPDNGGSPITGYRVYRGTEGGAESLVASPGEDVNSYTDPASGATIYYRVSAVNAVGEGPKSNKVFPVVTESACKMPGLTVATDTSDAAPNTPAVPQVNVKSLNVAEPYDGGTNKLVFTVKLGAGGAAPANSQWYVIWNRTTPDAAHDRNYVAMKTGLLGGITFEHGRVSYPLPIPPTSVPANQGNFPTKFGDVQGSYDSQTGTITFTVTNDKIDGVSAGQTLLGMEVRTFLGRNDGLPINQAASSDFSPAGQYTLVGNASCLVAPAAPTGLTAVSPRKAEITLNWADNSANEDGFVIERSTSVDGGFAEVATVGANATGYADRGVLRRVTYYYRVRAVNGGGKSAYSNVASARTK